MIVMDCREKIISYDIFSKKFGGQEIIAYICS